MEFFWFAEYVDWSFTLLYKICFEYLKTELLLSITGIGGFSEVRKLKGFKEKDFYDCLRKLRDWIKAPL